MAVTPDAIFSIANTVALIGWLLLIIVPRRRWATLTAGTVIPLAIAVTYLVVLALHWGETKGGFSSLTGVAELFSNRWALLAGWIHYLAFDLFVGTWETRDAMARGVPRWLLVPCLLLTFMFGPIGFLAYHAARRATSASAARDPASRRSDR
jgi:hypothetical protein